MRITRKQAELNRQRIVDSAITLFAQRGVESVGVAEVMADAGFTHGGFYNHFASKDDLVLEACSTSLAQSVALLRHRQQRSGDADFGACFSAPMLSESSKTNSRLSSLYANGIREFLAVLTEQYGDHDLATAALASFVGTRAISRAVQSADRDLADEFEPALVPPP